MSPLRIIKWMRSVFWSRRTHLILPKEVNKNWRKPLNFSAGDTSPCDHRFYLPPFTPHLSYNPWGLSTVRGFTLPVSMPLLSPSPHPLTEVKGLSPVPPPSGDTSASVSSISVSSEEDFMGGLDFDTPYDLNIRGNHCTHTHTGDKPHL